MKIPTMEEVLFSSENPLDITKEASPRPEPKDIAEPKEGNGWGGHRDGSGRKPVYIRFKPKRLKCRFELSDLANAFINILDKFSKRLDGKAWACRLDGQEPKPKGSGTRTWVEYDAIMSDFPISFDRQSAPRLFAVAFILSHAEGVAVQAVTDRHATLRWQRADEVSRIMTRYGFLLARRNRLSKQEEELLNTVPYSLTPNDMAEWITNHLK